MKIQNALLRKSGCILSVVLLIISMFTITSCKDNSIQEGFVANNGLSLSITDANGAPISGATVWIPSTAVATSVGYAKTFFQSYLAELTDPQGNVCNDPLTEFIAAACTNALGLALLSCTPGIGSVDVQIAVNNVVIDTVTLNCNGGPATHQVEGFTGGTELTEAIMVNVNNVPDMDSCEDNLYAVTYSDFDTRADESQVALTQDGTTPTTWSGELPVAEGATNVMVYIYCDTSTGSQTYDNDPPGSPSTVMFTNTAQFNACDRAVVPASSEYETSTTYSYYYSYGSSSNPWSHTYPSFFYNAEIVSANNSDAAAGDEFTSVVADEGDTVDVNLGDLTPLSAGSAHDADFGTYGQVCNCRRAANHYFSYTNSGSPYRYQTYYTTTSSYHTSGSSYTSYGAYYYVTRYTINLFNNWTSLILGTDDARLSDSSSGSCVSI